MEPLPLPFPQRLCELIDARIADPLLNVDEMARSLGLSRRHLLRKSVAHTGEVPSELLRRRRLQVGQALIEQGCWTRVRDIAARVGMSSGYFSRLYRSAFGEPPRRAIRRHLETTSSFAFPALALDLD